MNNTFCAALLACALLIAPCAHAEEVYTHAEPAQTEQENAYDLWLTTKEANLRSKPATKAARINTLLKGKKVKLLEEVLAEDGKAWGHVRVVQSGQEGFILMSLLEKIPDPTPTPMPTATPEPTEVPTPSPSPTPDGPIIETFEEPLLARTTIKANLRTEPDGKRIDSLPTGTHVTVLAQAIGKNDKLWYQTKEESGREGFVLAELLHQIHPAQLASISEEEVRALFPVLSCDPLEDAKNAGLPAYSEEGLEKYTTLSEGTRSPSVLRLKKRLYEMGYFKKPNENYNYTESTADVIEQFQKDVGLPATGVADALTQAALFDEHTPKKAGSAQEPKYLNNRDAALYIQKTDVTNYNFHGSLQLSVRNNSGSRLTSFAIKAIPYMRDGSAADLAETFAEEIEREYPVYDISIADGDSYSDFYTNDKFDDGVWPHHFEISNQIYFSGAQLAVCWYRAGGKTVHVDDDQMVFVSAGIGAGDQQMYTLPIALTAKEQANSGWEMGVVTRYVLPVYQAHYNLPQGAWVKTVNHNTPAQDAGLMPGDVIVGIGDVTILGDATLRKARGQIEPGESAKLYFWRDGEYYVTDIVRPQD